MSGFFFFFFNRRLPFSNPPPRNGMDCTQKTHIVILNKVLINIFNTRRRVNSPVVSEPGSVFFPRRLTRSLSRDQFIHCDVSRNILLLLFPLASVYKQYTFYIIYIVVYGYGTIWTHTVYAHLFHFYRFVSKFVLVFLFFSSLIWF